MTYQPLTLEYAIKQANKVRKQKSLTHAAARDFVAQSYGYKGWLSMLESLEQWKKFQQ